MHGLEPLTGGGGLGKPHRILDDPYEEIVALGPASSTAGEHERGGCDDQAPVHGPAH